MRHFPIFMDLAGRTALVIGVGEAAERRAAVLGGCGAVVRRAAGFSPELLEGCVVAIGAEAPEADLQALAAAARGRCIPVNVVDRPDLCTFITPSVIDRDPLGIAVSSGGAAPVLARLVRARIEAVIAPEYGRLAAFAGRFKEALRARLPDVAARRRVLEAALDGPVAELVFAGREDEAAALFEAGMGTAGARAEGMVFLVGAGPGAADLLTLRAQRLLGEADVIVHDRLVGAAVLEMARRDATRIDVGKARARHCVPQPEINALLVRLAREGRRVVRLKGGDPLVFGRGGEEAEALRAAGVRHEIVPGITAALACAAQAGIALTHRDAARRLTLVTGHASGGTGSGGRLEVEYGSLVRGGGTIAVYMGVAALAELRDGLLRHGLAAGTPAALIESGGRAEQRSLFGTIGGLPERALGWSGAGPALVLIGDAVGRAPGWAADQQGATAAAAGNSGGGRP